MASFDNTIDYSETCDEPAEYGLLPVQFTKDKMVAWAGNKLIILLLCGSYAHARVGMAACNKTVQIMLF